MRYFRGLRRVPLLLWKLLLDPGQVKFIPAWWRLLQASPIAARVPWLPFRVLEVLDQHLTPASTVFEYGGGGSTLWFADRAGQVVTVEHDPEWFPVLDQATAPIESSTVIHKSAADDYREYVAAIESYPAEYFDIVVVDGRERVRSLEAAIEKVRPGGLLVLDDSERARYAPAFELVADWPHKTYSGLTPSKTVPGTTTVWRRPGAN